VDHSNRLREWRKSVGLTLGEVAALTGLSIAALSRVERGERNMAPLTRVRFARLLGVPLAELFPPPTEFQEPAS
jgi:transcriptional regulator with XRE-family HTH domain